MPSTNNYTGQAIETSFLGLQSYTEAQSNSFFGRDTEIDTLTSLIELNTLTIVFGRSGTGKTSLLNAGVFPKLRKSFCLPFRIRLEFNDSSPDLLTQIKKVLKEEIDKYGFKVEAYPSSETLWEYFHKEPLWKTVTPILVFDQFEEIFTLSKANPRFASAELPAFWEELSDLIENNIPEKLKDKFLNQKEKIGYNYKKQKAKIVFSFREEYLPEFESIAAKIPSLKYSRFRLLPMNGNQAYEVITKTWKENITSKEAKHIVSFFTNEPGVKDDALVTVEPSLLSQVCAFIDKERLESGGGKVSSELLTRYHKDAILRSIYEDTILAGENALPASYEKEVPDEKNKLKKFIEEKLITTEGFRLKYNLSEKDGLLRPGINVLITRYFIREDDDAVELTHDVLAPIIKSDREKRRNEIEAAIARKRARRKAAILIVASILLAGIAFGISAYLSNEEIKALNDAKIEAGKLEVQKKDLEAQKKSLDDQIDAKKKILASIGSTGGKDDPKTIIVVDSTSFKEAVDILKKEIDDLEKQRIALDSTATSLRLSISENSRIKTEKEIEITDLKNKIRILENKSGADKVLIGQLKNQVELLNKQVESLNSALIKSRDSINRLTDSVKFYKNMAVNLNKTNQNLINRNPGNINSNLRIQVYDKSGPERMPITKDTFAVYIIPLNNKNKEVLQKNEALLYSKDCDGFNKIRNDLIQVQQAYYQNGYYYPPNVLPNGKYKIKICNILDGYFNLKLPSSSGSVFWRLAPKDKIEIKLGTF